MKSYLAYSLALAAVLILALMTAGYQGGITLVWDHASGSDVEGYVIRYGNRSGGPYPNAIEVGYVTQYTFQTLDQSQSWYFVVCSQKTHNGKYIESWPCSNEASSSGSVIQSPGSLRIRK